MVEEISSQVPKQRALNALGVSRASFYRHSTRKNETAIEEKSKTIYVPRSSLSKVEKEETMAVLCSERFVDKNPYEVYATLMDEGQYLCSVRTMYRLLKGDDCVKERRAIAKRTHYLKPELVAERPNHVWSWDITKLKGTQKWQYYYLYVMVDIFSRYIVGWMVAPRENALLAKTFIHQTVEKYDLDPKELTIHSDRGSPMTAKCTAQLFADLGLSQSLSRPHVSNDNAISESCFKTIKYSAGFPDKFDNIQSSRAFCKDFMSWYNSDHKHINLALFTPEMVHFNQIEEVAKKRQHVLDLAYEKNPSRFSRRPVVKRPPTAVYINRPEENNEIISNPETEGTLAAEGTSCTEVSVPRPSTACIFPHLHGKAKKSGGASVSKIS